MSDAVRAAREKELLPYKDFIQYDFSKSNIVCCLACSLAAKLKDKNASPCEYDVSSRSSNIWQHFGVDRQGTKYVPQSRASSDGGGSTDSSSATAAPALPGRGATRHAQNVLDWDKAAAANTVLA